jgi:hypothetical protein
MEHRSELLRLLSALCDEQLTEADQVRLEELLADQEARQLYLQYLDMHARLLTHPAAGGESHLPGVDVLAGLIGNQAQAAVHRSQRSERRRGRSLQVLSYFAVAAATLAATILVQVAVVKHRRPARIAAVSVARQTYVATLSQAIDAEWGHATEAYRVGARVLSGDLSLRKGVARLAYDGGVELIIEGPADLRLESGSAATLLSGKIVFRADDASAPFTLKTPSSVLVDLGTEYAVEVGQDQEEVHVFSGEVQRLPKEAARDVQPQLLAAGEARRYSDAGSALGEAAAIEPTKFVRQLPAAEQASTDATSGLLAYEGFEYADATALRTSAASGGSGFIGAWGGGFARAPEQKADDQLALNVAQGLVREGAGTESEGGSFEHAGFAKYFRRLATPLRMDSDGVYYLSYLFRREGLPRDPLNSVSIQFRQTEELEVEQQAGPIDLRKRLNFGIDKTNELFTHLERIGHRMPLPLSYGETYLLTAKVAASSSYPDQVFLRIYGPQEPVDREEPASWSVVGPSIESDLVFDWLEIHINSHTRQTIDEIRIGTTWASVAAPWTK